MSLRLFGEFGPPAFRSYIDTPPKRRWLPLLVALGVGGPCVLAAFALPLSRADVKPTVRIYTPPNISPANNTFLAVAEPQPAQPPAKLQEERPLIEADQPTISPSLKILAEPIDIAAPPRRLATKGRATTNRRVARKSRRHERNDAYARYYDPRRNSYYGGYAGYWR